MEILNLSYENSVMYVDIFLQTKHISKRLFLKSSIQDCSPGYKKKLLKFIT